MNTSRGNVHGSLARGFVRQEARQITSAHQDILTVPSGLEALMAPRFRARQRLSVRELHTLVEELNRKVAGAFNSVYSSVTNTRSEKVMPGAPR